MSTLQITISDELNRDASHFARNGGLTLEEFIAKAVEAQVAALHSTEYWKARAARANPDDLLRVLETAPDAPPEPGDEMSPENAAYYRKLHPQNRQTTP